MGKRNKSEKANGIKRYELPVTTFPVRRWKTTQDALAFLRGDFADWIEAMNDLAESEIGIHAPVLVELAQVARVLADFLEEPGEVVEDEMFASGREAEIAVSLAKIGRLLSDHLIEYENPAGEGSSISGSTLRVMASAVAKFAQDAEAREYARTAEATR